MYLVILHRINTSIYYHITITLCYYIPYCHPLWIFKSQQSYTLANYNHILKLMLSMRAIHKLMLTQYNIHMITNTLFQNPYHNCFANININYMFKKGLSSCLYYHIIINMYNISLLNFNKIYSHFHY